MAGRTTSDLLWRFLADTKSLDRGSRRAEGDMRTVDRGSSRMSQGLGLATRALGALGLGLGAVQLKDFALESAALARTADSVAGSFDKVFGPAAAGLRDELDETRRSMGLGIDEMEGMLLTTGTLAVGMGLPSESAAELSGKLFTLAGDLQAFNPAAGSTEEALAALQAAMRGEFDPLEKFGAKLSQAEINTRALADSAASSVGDLSAQEKALAAVDLALEKTAVQAGALEEANRAGKLEAQKNTAKLRDLRIEIGRQLIPVLDDLTVAFGNSLGATDDLSVASENLIGPVKNASQVIRDMTTDADGASKAKTILAGAIGLSLDSASAFVRVLGNNVIGKKLHELADGARDAADNHRNLADRVKDPFEPLQVLVRRAGDAATALHGAGGAALDMGDDMNASESDVWDLAGALSALGKFGYRQFPGAQPSIAVPEPDVLPTPPTTGRQAGADQRFHTGGIVPGPPGTEVPAVLQAGEKVLTRGEQRAAAHGVGGGAQVTINVTAIDPQGAAEAVAEAIRLYEQTNGPIR